MSEPVSPVAKLARFMGDKILVVAAVAALAVGAYMARSAAAEKAVTLPAPAFVVSEGSQPRIAVFAGGCFWGVQAVFQHTKGVLGAVSGYAGGAADSANYQAVSSGTTGHAESVKVTYDPSQVSYGKLLQIYFSVAHDPTQLDAQGPDHGPQYRSALFYADEGQRQVAQRYIAQLEAAPRISEEDRDADRTAHGVPSRRGLPPGLRDAEPALPLHRRLRPPEDREPEEAHARGFPRAAGPGVTEPLGR